MQTWECRLLIISRNLNRSLTIGYMEWWWLLELYCSLTMTWLSVKLMKRHLGDINRSRPNQIAGLGRDRLENRSHVVPKTEFQDGGGRTRIFTHNIVIFADFGTEYPYLIGWEAGRVTLDTFASHAGAAIPQSMPRCRRWVSLWFALAVCFHNVLYHTSNLVMLGDWSLGGEFHNIVGNVNANFREILSKASAARCEKP